MTVRPRCMRRLGVLLIVAGGLVGATALAAVPPASADDASEPRAGEATAPVMVPPHVPRYEGDAVEPVKVLMIGDSSVSGVDVPLQRFLRARGYPSDVIQRVRGATGIGGINPVPPNTDWDWLVVIRQFLERNRPDVVVAQFVGSFGDPVSTTARGARFVDIVHEYDAEVVWVRTPAIRSADQQPYYDAIITALDAIPADARTDWRGLITPRDRWWEYGTTDRGVERVRPDNLHFTPAGRRLLARATAATLVDMGLWGARTDDA